MASTHAAKNGWKPRRRRHASRVWGKWGWGANELARSGDAGVGALCRCAHASGLRFTASEYMYGNPGTGSSDFTSIIPSIIIDHHHRLRHIKHIS